MNKFIGCCDFLTSAYGLIGKDAGLSEQRRGFDSRCAHFSFVQDRVPFCHLLSVAHSWYSWALSVSEPRENAMVEVWWTRAS